MSCCGGKRKGNGATYDAMIGSRVRIPMDSDTVLLEYIGEQEGTLTFYGVSTGTQYKVTSNQHIIEVDIHDAVTKVQRKPGLLEIAKNDRPIFKRAKGE